jgi:hypothetical protein
MVTSGVKRTYYFGEFYEARNGGLGPIADIDSFVMFRLLGSNILIREPENCETELLCLTPQIIQHCQLTPSLFLVRLGQHHHGQLFRAQVRIILFGPSNIFWRICRLAQ